MGPKRRPLVSVPLSAANVAIAAARKEAQELGYTQGYADAVAKMQAEDAELRALREVAEAARAFLPTCERVICGGATTRECGAAATHESQFGVVLCDLHRSNVPRPLDPHPRVDALRAALAKVPR